MEVPPKESSPSTGGFRGKRSRKGGRRRLKRSNVKKIGNKRSDEREAARNTRIVALQKAHAESLLKADTKTAVAESQTALVTKENQVLTKELRVTKRKLVSSEQLSHKLRQQLGASKASTKEAEERAKRLKKALHDKEERCKKSCITVPKVGSKQFKDLSSRSARQARLTQYLSLLEELQAKMKMQLSSSEQEVATKYWKAVYQVDLSPDKPESDETECRDSLPADIALAEWDKKWKILFKLRYVADNEGSVSSSALRRIFMAAEMSSLTGGKLDTLRHAMDRAIAKRIRQYDIEYGDNKDHGGMWLDPTDVVREMLTAAGAKPGQKYHINVLADGRAFGNSRNTTFFALRIVYLDGYSSTATEAIWPLAILDCEEKRGAVRVLTRPLRQALKHLQLNGCVLPEEYSRHFYNDADAAAWKKSRESMNLADAIGQAGRMSGRFAEEEDNEQIEEDNEQNEVLLDASAMISEAKARGELPPAEIKKQAKRARKARTAKFTTIQGLKRKAAADRDDVFNFSKSAAEEGEEVEPQSEGEEEPDLAFWDMKDDDCGSDTDFSPYECDHASCPCSSKTGAQIAIAQGEREPVPLEKRKVAIELWLSADMKFLLMALGMKCATAKHACIYCKCDIHKRRDWLESARGTSGARKATDAIDEDTGQARKNLFGFIPRDHCVIDVLHLLLRCMDRMVHVACNVVLQVFAPNVTNEAKQKEFLDTYLGPVFAKAMQKGRVQFNPPAGSTTLWTLNRINGVGYRRLLDNFRFEDVRARVKTRLTTKQASFVKRYQGAWDGFRAIYKEINSKTPNAFKTKNLINSWFLRYVDDYIEQTAEGTAPGDKPRPMREDRPAFLASFLLTPYFHCLLVHVPGMVREGRNLRDFTGQNFERANNEHRLYWQNCSKVQGDEIPAVIRQHLRVRMNPVENQMRAASTSLQCPECSHKPYKYWKSLETHFVSEHSGIIFTKDLFINCVDAATRGEALAVVATQALKDAITTDAYPELVKEKQTINRSDHACHKEDRKRFQKIVNDIKAVIAARDRPPQAP